MLDEHRRRGKKRPILGKGSAAGRGGRRSLFPAMNTPSLIEVLIVALVFSIVGTYVLCCRHFLNASEAEPAAPTTRLEPSGNEGSAHTRPTHA